MPFNQSKPHLFVNYLNWGKGENEYETSVVYDQTEYQDIRCPRA